MSPIQELAGAYRRLCRLSAAAVLCAAAAGCAMHAPPKPDEARVKQFSARGYAAEARYGVSATQMTWTLGAERLDLALTLPDKPGKYPLIIYLPGLGESGAAGNVWRGAWTQAGYAVLSLQPVAEDEVSWHSPKARSGDFAGLARARYSAQAMSARMHALQAVWNELGQRQARGEAPLDRIDLTHVGIAGFDLGAYTAMAIAGENIKDMQRPALSIPVAAVIALSPYADFSGATFAERFRDIRGPVLSVTTDSDADAIGVVTSPSVRKAPYEYMPAKDKYLMLIWGVPHFALGGNDAVRDPGAASMPAEKPDTGGGSRPQGGPPGSRPRGKLPAAGKSESDQSNAVAGGIISATANAIGTAAIVGVTTAFFDSYLKNDEVAREWLEKDTARWLREKGEFKKK